MRGRCALATVPAHDLGDIVLRFFKRRDAAVFAHLAGASIIGGQGQVRVSERVKLLTKIPRTAPQIVLVIVRINAKIGSRARHQLGKANRAGRGSGVLVEAAFSLDQSRKQIGVNALFDGDHAGHFAVIHQSSPSCAWHARRAEQTKSNFLQ